MYSVIPEVPEKRLRDISLVSVELAEHFVCQGVHHCLVPVVDVRTGKDGADYLPLLVVEEMQLKPDVPSHGAPAFGGDIPEDLHAVLPLVVDDRDACAVEETDYGALPEAYARLRNIVMATRHLGMTLTKRLQEKVSGKRYLQWMRTHPR